MTIAILYICTGKYDVFWKDFYLSSEKFFLTNHKKEYFVFTDKDISPINDRIHLIDQQKLGWPYDTLMRFQMFNSIRNKLEGFDFIFFFNANMRFLKSIDDSILPNNQEGLLAVKHPGFFNKNREEFTYETNPSSLAYIPDDKGEYYFMGGLNGGLSKNYLDLIGTLNSNINEDLENNIIALWHDESHLNKYLLGKNPKILGPEYGYPEGSDLALDKKIIILDKKNFGGHNFLRETKTAKKPLYKTILTKLKHYFTTKY